MDDLVTEWRSLSRSTGSVYGAFVNAVLEEQYTQVPELWGPFRDRKAVRTAHARVLHDKRARLERRLVGLLGQFAALLDGAPPATTATDDNTVAMLRRELELKRALVERIEAKVSHELGAVYVAAWSSDPLLEEVGVVEHKETS